MKQNTLNGFMGIALLAMAALSFNGCGGIGSGGGTGSDSGAIGSGAGGGSSTTTISGKVSLSSNISSKPSLKGMMALNAPKGKPGSKIYLATRKPVSGLSKSLPAPKRAASFANGKVFLYNSDHPEWLCPVSDDDTDSKGNYSMGTLKYASCNGGVYAEGDPIPSGNYTLLAYQPGGFDPIMGTTTKELVAIQMVVKKFEGQVSADLEVQESDAPPKVIAMFGVLKNTDGTQTWGSAASTLPANAALQVSFSMAMSRGTLQKGISIYPPVLGKWALSADWLTATFYPETGASFMNGTTYTVTVNGTGTTYPVKNVYGNPIAKIAVGTFTATAEDTGSPTVTLISPNTTSGVDIITPVRISSDKALDVNSLLLSATPSLGAKSGVLYIGKTSGQYIYEFVLGEPLKLSTTYDFTITGSGLNGKQIVTDKAAYSFTTSSSTAGVDSTAAAATQAAQAKVKDAFGKWIRSMNDRNITQLQSMMTGDFYMEYDVSLGTHKEDINRDGRYSLGEFSDMMANNAFLMWDYCATTVTGNIIGTINVVGNTADFEFTLSASSTNQSKRCGEAAPDGSLYATLENKNGSWVIVRASEGVDTRTKLISHPDLIPTQLYENETPVAEGGKFTAVPSGTTTIAKYGWDAVPGVTSYVVVAIDARNPDKGVAVALPTTLTSIYKILNTTYVESVGGKDVSSKFGFQHDPTMPFYVEGGEYYWEVVGFGTTGVTDFATKTNGELLRDIAAISTLKRFTMPGTYKELSISVSPFGGTPVTFSEIVWGYDVGNANQATITVTTPNTTTPGGYLSISGNFYNNYPLTFTGGVVTQTVGLSKGQNWISVDDGSGLYKSFNIQTTGGIPPVIDLANVVDDNGNTLTGDDWNYYTATSGATRLTLSGTVSDPAVTTLNINVWNQNGAQGYATAPLDCSSLPCTFSKTIDIYNGDNWINISDNNYYYYSYLGVYTDTGAVWVPPITITGITTATQTSNYGNSSDWDASADTDNTVTIAGKFKTPVSGTYNYNIWGEGGGSSGILSVLPDGTFSLNADLYNGWNYISLNDSNYNWYGANIYTSAGKTVIKTQIISIDGQPYSQPLYGGVGTYNSTSCVAVVAGTAPVGNMNVNWNGYDGMNYYYDSQDIVTDGSGNFSVTVPLVGGTSSYNNIDIYDLNWKWTGVTVTTTGACAFANPLLTLSSVKNSGGTPLTDTGGGNYNAGSSNTVTISGASNKPGRSIVASISACGKEIKYKTNAATTPNGSGAYDWAISGIAVYDGSSGVNLTDGNNWQYINVSTSNGTLPPPPALQVTSVVGATETYPGCSSSEWDAGAASPVTISGTTSAPDGTGNYVDSTGGSNPFTITGGSFSIVGVALYNGYNDISIYDTAMNYYSVRISTTGGTPKPKMVSIGSPLNNTTGLSGINIVAGTISLFTTSHVYASVYSAETWMYTYYSSDLYDQQIYGDQPISFDGTSFSFNVDYSTGTYSTSVNVYAYDDISGMSHGHSIYLNDILNLPEYWYKPGRRSKVATSKMQVVNAEFLEKNLKNRARRKNR